MPVDPGVAVTLTRPLENQVNSSIATPQVIPWGGGVEAMSGSCLDLSTVHFITAMCHE
jgi:hypothetical protein